MSRSTNVSVQSDSLDVSPMFFENISLLGFNAVAMTKKYRIPFDSEMFTLPNKTGCEVIMHFLFTCLDPAYCHEHFSLVMVLGHAVIDRDCWPVTDKKDEMKFRKKCGSWLEQIIHDDPEAHLPRVGASLFLSPGGDKFVQFLFCFSRYVLYRVMYKRGSRSLYAHPVLTPHDVGLATVVAEATVANTHRLQQKFIECCHQQEIAQSDWVSFSDQLVNDYRTTVGRCRELERCIKAEKYKMTDSGRTKHHGAAADYDVQIQNVQRAQSLQHVRELWKSFEDFHTSVTANREIIDSITQRCVEKYRLDATAHPVRLPDLLLRECEQEIQRRHVENIYREGKVNLLSLVHLYNLSLHLLIEKMHEVGLPNLDEFITEASTMLQTHHNRASSIETCSKQLEFELLPDILRNVEILCQKREERLSHLQSPNALRVASLGLLPPTPPVSFEPHDVEPLSTQRHDRMLRLDTSDVSTPDGASQLLEDIDSKIQQHGSSSLVQGTPIFGPRTLQRTRDQARPKSPVLAAATSSPMDSKSFSTPKQHLTHHTRKQSSSQAQPAKPSVVSNRHASQWAKTSCNTSRPKASAASTTRGAMSRSYDKPSAVASKQRSHMDHLADRIVDMVMSSDNEQLFTDAFDPLMEMDINAFKPADKIQHSPTAALVAGSDVDVPTTLSSLLSANVQPEHGSIIAGPLSSTMLDVSNHNVEDVNTVDSVVTKLFAPIQPYDGEEDIAVGVAPKTQGKAQCWDSVLRACSAPSTIHSDSSRDGNGAVSEESSLLESIDGRTRDRVLSSDNESCKAGRQIQSVELWKLPDDVGDDDAACSYVDVGDIQLNETLKSLMETKTPMLPSRLRTALKPQRSYLSSSTNVEPRKVATHPVSFDDIPPSVHDHVPSAVSESSNYSREFDVRHYHVRQSTETDNQLHTDADCKTPMVLEFLNGSYSEFSKKSAVQSKNNGSVGVPVETAGYGMPVRNSSLSGAQSVPAQLSSDVHCSPEVSSVAAAAAAECQLLEYSAPDTDVMTSPLLAMPDADSLDSLIARYRNLRDCSTVESKLTKTSAGQLPDTRIESEVTWFAEHLTSANVAVNLTAADMRDTADTVNKGEITETYCSLQPSVVDSHVVQRSADNAGVIGAAADNVDDLCNDSFDDIQLGLQNVSVDGTHTPLHHSSTAKDSSLLNASLTSYHAIPMSPLTDALHRSGDVRVSSVVDPTDFDIHTRFHTSFNEDIFREDGSLLIPASPANDSHRSSSQSHHTATLVNLSLH